jgi:hypothetical protein
MPHAVPAGAETAAPVNLNGAHVLIADARRGNHRKCEPVPDLIRGQGFG